jgi:hypothetical protein
MLLNGGRSTARPVSWKTVELMTKDHLGKEIPIYPATASSASPFGRSRRTLARLRRRLHLGGIFNTVFWVDLKEELIPIFLRNFSFTIPMAVVVKTLVYQAIEN